MHKRIRTEQAESPDIISRLRNQLGQLSAGDKSDMAFATFHRESRGRMNLLGDFGSLSRQEASKQDATNRSHFPIATRRRLEPRVAAEKTTRSNTQVLKFSTLLNKISRANYNWSTLSKAVKCLMPSTTITRVSSCDLKTGELGIEIWGLLCRNFGAGG